MIKKFIVSVAFLFALVANAQDLPKGKVIKDIVKGTQSSSPLSFLNFDNSTLVFNSYDFRYYRINESLNNAVLVPALDEVRGILYSDNDRIIYQKQVGLTYEVWLYRATTNTHIQIPGFSFDAITSNGNVSNDKLYFFAEFKGSNLFADGIRRVLAYITLNESDDDLRVHLRDFNGGLSPTSTRWLEKNGNLYCYCNGVKDDIYPSLNSFSGQLCGVSFTKDTVIVYDGLKILYDKDSPGFSTNITGIVGDNVFFEYNPGQPNSKGNEPYKFNVITKNYSIIQDLSLGKTVTGADANSTLTNVIYDKDALYFMAKSDAVGNNEGFKLYSFQGGQIAPEELINFTPVLPLNDGYVLLMAGTSAHIRNINIGITNPVMNEETNSPLLLSDSYKDIFTRNTSINRGEADSVNTYYFEKDGKFVVSFDGNFHLIDPQNYQIKRISNNTYSDTSSMVTSDWFFTTTLNDSIVRFFYNGRNSKVGSEPAYLDIDFKALSVVTSLDNNSVEKTPTISLVEVYTMQGQKIGTGTTDIIKELPEGMYIVRYYSDNGTIKSEKIGKVINR